MSEKNQEERNTEEGGISLREIFRIIGKRIWWVFASSLAVAVAAALLFMFVINPSRLESSKSFKINYPFAKTEKYLDGSMFNYRDIISRENIARAVESNEKLKSLDVDAIVKSGAVSISAKKEYEEEFNSSYVYTIVLQRGYFNGVDPDEFIEALSDAFASSLAAKVDNMIYSISPDTMKDASFKDQLTILDQQKEILLKQYDTWISQYNAGYVIDDGVNKKSLGNYRTETMIAFADNVRTPIENELKIYGYEYFNALATAESIRQYVDQLERRIEMNTLVIKNLKEAMQSDNAGTAPSPEPTPQAYSASPSTYAVSPRASTGTVADENSEGSSSSVIIMPGDSNLSQRLAYYIEQNAILEQQIKHLRNEKDKNTVTDADYQEVEEAIRKYENKFIAQRDKLNACGDNLKKAISQIYLNDTFFVSMSQFALSQGGTSTVLVAGAGFAVAFAVLLAVAYCIGARKKKSAESVVAEYKLQSEKSTAAKSEEQPEASQDEE